MERFLAEKMKIPLKKFDMNRYRTSFFTFNFILVTHLLYIFLNPKQQEFSVNS